MTGSLIRTASIPLHRPHFSDPLAPPLSLRLHDSFDNKNDAVFSPKFDLNRSPKPGIRRSVSDTNIYRSVSSRASAVRSFSSGILEADKEIGNGFPVDEDEFPGGGFGNGRRYGGDGGGAGGGREDHRSDIGVYYQRMLKSNPSDSLLLRNYGKYLHEVEKDTVRAEECYGRAILASPGDGELLSLYGNLIWETRRDGETAKSYFDQALRASPGDSTVLGVLGSYAHFLWEADEQEEEIEQETATGGATN